MHVMVPQRAYVAHDRRLGPAIYCAGPRACTGLGRLQLGGRTIASGPIQAAPAASARVPMRLSTADYRELLAAPGNEESVRLVLKGARGLGTFSAAIKIGQ
jgi:hypothetical protein